MVNIMKEVDIVLADTTTLRDGILYDKKAVKELYECLNAILKKKGKIYIQDSFTRKRHFILDLDKVIGEVYKIYFDEISGTLSITELSAKNLSQIESNTGRLRVSFNGKIKPTSSFRNEELEGVLEKVDEVFYIAIKE